MCQEENESRGICYAFCFLPLALYVYGWFDKGVEYDKVEIYDGKKKASSAIMCCCIMETSSTLKRGGDAM